MIRLFKWLIKPKYYSGIITAQVTKIDKHPNADRLRVVELSDGVQTVAPVVCGAFNFEVGDKVALALPGAFIPKNIHSDKHEGFTLEKATIRGVESRGMICSAYELGLAEDTTKAIIVLKQESILGKPFDRRMIK